MNLEQHTVTYLYRNKGATVSIERLFSCIRDELNHDAHWIQKEQFVPYRTVRNPMNILRNIAAYKDLKSDIFHVTGDINYVAIGLPRERTILTVHDLNLLEYKLIRNPVIYKYYELLWCALPVKHCARIVAISEWTKQALLRHSNIAPDRIVVIPNCFSPQFSFRQKQERKQVILVVGTMSNKNVISVIHASAGMNVTLRIIGVMDETLWRAAEKLGVTISNEPYVPDERMPDEYHNADALIFPTLYEGFGVPIIEAQATGTPVLTSNLEPMKSVAGDGALLVDPKNINSIRDGIIKILNDEILRNDLIEKGLENSKKYSAKIVSEQYRQLYYSIV